MTCCQCCQCCPCCKPVMWYFSVPVWLDAGIPWAQNVNVGERDFFYLWVAAKYKSQALQFAEFIMSTRTRFYYHLGMSKGVIKTRPFPHITNDWRVYNDSPWLFEENGEPKTQSAYLMAQKSKYKFQSMFLG